MEQETDIILEEADNRLSIIEVQLTAINSVIDLDESIYEGLQDDKIKVISSAMKLILKIQRELIKDI